MRCSRSTRRARRLSPREAYDDARAVLLGTACATRDGAFALLRHLHWWLVEEAPNAAAMGEAWVVAQAREADLALLLGCDGVRRIPVALPSGRLVSAPVEPIAPGTLPTIEAGPAPAPALVRFGRALSLAGEAVAAAVLIVAGCGLTGLASLL